MTEKKEEKTGREKLEESIRVHRMGKRLIEETAAQLKIEEVPHLRQRVKNQARELTKLREAQEKRNREADALGRVWCSGGCAGGMHRYAPEKPVTAEQVAFLMDNACRAASWYVNAAGKGEKDFSKAWGRARAEIDSARKTQGGPPRKGKNRDWVGPVLVGVACIGVLASLFALIMEVLG